MQKKSFLAPLAPRNPQKWGLAFNCEAVKHCGASGHREAEAAAVWGPLTGLSAAKTLQTVTWGRDWKGKDELAVHEHFHGPGLPGVMLQALSGPVDQ